MKEPRISIIIPVYNVEKYVEECLDSVGKQSISDKIECIIVDDKGTDSSIAIVEAFCKSYKGDVKFKIVYRERNGGLSAARNTGVKEAQGEYLYFLDSDDYIIPSAMETLLTKADKHGGVDLLPAMYISKMNYMKSLTCKTLPEFTNDRKIIKKSLLDYHCIPVTAANRLINRDFFIKNSLWFKTGIIHEDNYWTFFMCKYVKKFAICKEEIYFYRVNPDSIMHKKNISKEIYSYKTIIEDFSDNIDDFLPGMQKQLLINTFIIVKEEHYFDNIKELIFLKNKIKKTLTPFESLIFSIYLHSNNNKILHLLYRFFNIKD